MFQFISTHVINSNLDSSGKPRWTSQAEDTMQDPVVKGSFNVKRVNKFIKDNVVSIYKRVGYNPTLATITFKIKNEGVGLYRIALYIGYSGNRVSFFANDMVFQGKPMWIEYEISSNEELASDIAKKIVKNAGLYKQMWDNKVFEISASGDTVTIKACDEYELFKKADIEKLLTNEHVCACSDVCSCSYQVVKSALQAEDPNHDGENTIVQGKPGFGTYTNLIHDFRLPTMEAVRFGGINQEELPIPGALYNQYTIEYCKRRGIMGSDVVGHDVKSTTTHVFYVKQDLASDFEAGLANIGTVEEIKKK